MSNNTLARLSVELAANTASFQGDLGKAARVAEKELGNIERNAVRMAGALVAGLAAGGGALAVLAKQSIDAADEMGELAQKVGMSTERLSAYNYIAKMSGADTDVMANAVKKLNVNMVDAANGQGAAKDAFVALGIELRDTTGYLKSNDTILEQVADRLSQMEDGAAKTALAVDIFGKAGADLIPMLNQGSRGFADLTAEAQRMGLIISTDVANAAGDFNDNLDRLQLSIRGLGNDVMQGGLPALNSLANAMLNENSMLRDSIRLVGMAGAAYVAATIALNAKVIALRVATIAQTAFNTAAKANPYALAAAGLALLVTGIYNYNKAIPEAIKRTNEASTAMSRFDLITRRAKDAIDEQNRSAAGMNLPQVKSKIESVANEIKHLEILHKRASADFARGAISAGLVSAYDTQLKQKKEQLEHLKALAGEKTVKSNTVNPGGDLPPPPPRDAVNNFDFGAAGLNFSRGDELAESEAASAAAYIERDKSKVQAALQTIQQGLMSKRQIEMQDMQQKQLVLQQSVQYELMTKAEQLAALEALEREHKGRIKVLDDEELTSKRESQRRMVDFVGNGLSAIAGKNKAAHAAAALIQNRAALKSIFIDTRAAAIGAYKAMAGIPYIGPALGVAAAGAAIAFGGAQAAALGGSVGGGASSGYSAGSTASTGSVASLEPRERPSSSDSITTGTTIVQIPEDSIMTARQIADMLDGVYASGKQPQNLRVMLT